MSTPPTSEPGPDLIQLWTAVTRGVSTIQHGLSLRSEDVGISPPYVPVLLLLLAAEGNRLPMSRIARDLAMTSGGFTKLADRMARDGLIDRRGSSGDRRVVFAALTDRGLEVAGEARDMYEAYLRDIVGPGHGEDLRKKLGDGPTGHELRKAALDKAGRTLGAGCTR